MADPTEDVPYNISEFATPEKEHQEDPDQPNKSVLLDVQKYLNEAIDEHKSVDTIDLSGSSELTAAQQVAISKFVIQHLRSVKIIVDNKLKELR